MAGLAAALLLAAVVPSAHAVGGVSEAANRGLKLGVWDAAFLSDDPATRAQWLDRTAGVGATQVTIVANWREIASGARPADPTDPSDPAYDWVLLDAAVRDATARGLSVMVMLFQAPDWAEGPSPAPPANAIPGSRRPSPRLLGQFARALGSRYSGEFPDPLAPGRSLPRVTLWQIWGEPNYGRNLNPQWERSGGKWRPAGPEHFRKMINAAYSSLKDVDRSNRVITGGFLPVGDYKRGGDRFEPLRFLREFFCLRGRRALKPKKCPGKKPHLDVLGHNPLSFGVSAFEPAAQPDDVWPPDMHKLTRVIRAARAHRRIVPRRGTELWVTELLALSELPFGVNQTTQANYLADALFVLWKQGVSQVTWVGIRDAGIAIGLYDDNGNPKLASQAFRFPFVARGKNKRRVRVWGMAPVNGGVNIERQTASGWQVIKTLGSNGRIFTGRVKGPQKAPLRATAGGEHSLTR